MAENFASPDRVLAGDVLVPGAAQGEKFALDKPLSFWGGYDSEAGRIIDPAHPQTGRSLAGKIMVMAHAKGSSSSSSVLAEAIRNGTGPAGIVLRERDLIISIGAIVAAELYGLAVPVVCLDASAFDAAMAAPGVLRIEAADEKSEARIYLE
jgi:predicted aconitase with swiveling domain